MRKVIIFLLALAAGPAQADTKPAARAVGDCYRAAAKLYGMGTCDAPSTLIGAVFGKCQGAEANLRDQIEKEGSDSGVSEKVVEILRDKLANEIQSWVADARLGSTKCQVPTQNSN